MLIFLIIKKLLKINNIFHFLCLRPSGTIDDAENLTSWLPKYSLLCPILHKLSPNLISHRIPA